MLDLPTGSEGVFLGKMTQPAFLYARFSALEQGRGTSLKRQLENARAYAQRKGWLVDPDREMADKGKSAFHGANRAPGGALYEFERKVELGLYRNGAVCVIEHFDRISRQGWEQVHAFLKLCTENGVSVATIDGDRFYPAGQRIDGNVIMELVWKGEGAREESSKKSTRGLNNWKFKVQAIEAGDTTVNIGLTPAWIDRDVQTGVKTLNAHRTAVLREIFDLYIEGTGLPSIVRLLNGRNEPSWGYGEKQSAAGWNTAYLSKLLKNRAVLGEYEANGRSHGSHIETSKGTVHTDFYPQAIPFDVFNEAREVAKTRKGRSSGRGEARLANLLSGSSFCNECGATMYFNNSILPGTTVKHKSKLDGRPLEYKARVAISYLSCNNARRLHSCTNRTRWRYEFLEPALLDAVLKVVVDDKRFVMTDEVEALTASAMELERQIEGKRHNLDVIVENLADMFVKALAAKAAAIEAEIDEQEATLATMREELARKTGQGSATEQLDRVREVRSNINSTDPEVRLSARSRVKMALIRLIRSNFHADGTVEVIVANGLMAFRFDKKGKLLAEAEVINDPDFHHGLVSGELEDNARAVASVLARRAS